MRHRVDAYTAQRTDVARQLQDVQLERARGAVSREQRDMVDVTHDLFIRIAETDSSSADKLVPALGDVIRHPDKYTNRDSVLAGTAGYTRAEQDYSVANGPYPKGYFELMNLMFDYQNRSDREDYFKKISRVVTPDKLASLIENSLNLGLGGANIYGVIDEVRDRIALGTVGTQELRRMVWNTANQMYDEAIVM